MTRAEARDSPWRVASWTWFDWTLAAEAVAFVALVGLRGTPTGSAVRVLAVVALTTLAVAVDHRARSVWSGLVGVAAGLTGLIAGLSIGVSFTARSGRSVMGVAGLVALGTGLALLAAGTVRLVRTTRGWRRWLAIPIGFVVLQFVVLPSFVAVVVANVPPDSPDPATPADRGLRYEDVTLRTADGVELSAWYVPSTNRAAVVVLAGSGSTRADALDQAAVLARHGYGALLVDHRGHGGSGGLAMDYGWSGVLDVEAAVGSLARRPDVDPTKVGVVGLSMGAEEALTAAADDPRIRAVVAEGATGRVAADHEAASGPTGWLEQIVLWEQYQLIDLLTEASPPRPLREAVAATAPRRLLLIAGMGEEAENRRFRDAAPSTVELWEPPDTPHVGALATHPTDWEQRVVTFLDDALGV